MHPWAMADSHMVKAQRTERPKAGVQGAMVREGPQEEPPEQGPEGQGGKKEEAEQTYTVSPALRKGLGERRLPRRDPVLRKSLYVAGVQNVTEGQGVMT